MAITAASVRAQAHDTFIRLRPAFNAHTIFWQQGHMLDTMVDYLGLVSPQEGAGFGEEALLKFLDRGGIPGDDGSVPNSPLWFDDYAWWGIAALNASRYPRLFGGLTRGFRGIADLMWEPMFRYAPNTWANACHDERYAPFEPKFEGGVWNWIYAPRKILSLPETPAGPDQTQISALESIQNTVTNSLYWVLTARLHADTGAQLYKDCANREYAFLRQWFTLPNPEESLMWEGKGDAIVRERVATYKNGNLLRGYSPELAWSGDQGLVLGGLVDHMALVGQTDPRYGDLLRYAQRLTQGVKTRMSEQGRLLPWVPYTNAPDHGAPGGDVDDYQTGVGVYMRYLGYAYRGNPLLRSHLETTGYREWLSSNVAQLKPSSKPLELTNNLATLVCWLVLHDALGP